MFSIANILSISLTLFVVIDVLGSVPVIIGVKQNSGVLKPLPIVLFAGALMVAFALLGSSLLAALGIQVKSFAIAGSVVLLLLALEMILGTAIFKSDVNDAKTASLVPLAFPVLIGAGTLTTILSLRTKYQIPDLMAGIAINLLIIFVVLLCMDWIEKKLSHSVLNVMKKFFGIILLALAVQMFMNNVRV